MQPVRAISLPMLMLLALLSLGLLGGCAATGSDEDQDFGGYDESTNDPLEPLNRVIFAANEAIDLVVIRNFAGAYRFVVPEPIRNGIRNFLDNLASPVILANDLFQGKGRRAETTLSRFVLNSTVGVLGFFDVATEYGYPRHTEDFGQTLGYHGVGEGAYLVLPILGPSSVRDAAGLVVDTLTQPLTYVTAANDLDELAIGTRVVDGIDFRSRNIETLDALKRDSLDFYARLRSLYRQRREVEINDGAVAPAALPDIQ